MTAAEGTGRAPPVSGRARLFLGLVLLVIPTRLAFLGAGYGADADAWRVMNTGRAIAERHAYQASRFPGVPIPELAAALLWRGGPWAMNSVTMLLSAAAAASFALALKRLSVQAAVAGALALALTPVIYIHSVDAMDYLWALAFLMAALALALESRPVLAGVALGIATGCRITSLAALVPLVLLLARGRPWRSALPDAARMTAAALVCGGIAWLPAVLTYGASFLTFYEHGGVPALYVAKCATVDVWGVVGVVAVALASVRALGVLRARRAAPAPGVKPLLIACAAAIAIYGALFLRLPHDGAYLIPAVPFVLLALALVLVPREFTALCVALMLSSYFLKVAEPGKVDGPRPSATSVLIRPGGHALIVDVVQGPILWDHGRRLAGLAFRDRVLARARALPGGGVIVAHEWLDWIRPELSPADRAHLSFVYLLDRERAAAAGKAGTPIYYLPDALGEELDLEGVDLRALGARPLLERTHPG